MLKIIDSKSLVSALKLWFLWILATNVGIAIVTALGGISIYLLIYDNQPSLADYSVTLSIAGALSGVIIGLSHWLVLRSKIIRGIYWIGATAISWSMSGIVLGIILGGTQQIDAIFAPVSSSVLILSHLGAAIIGGTIGLGQWLVIRHEVKQAKWWILATILGWVCAISAVVFVTELPVHGLIAVPVGATVLGMVTGVAVVFLFDQASHRALNTAVLSGLGLFVILGSALLANWKYSQQALVLRGHDNQVYTVAFSSDGAILASGGFDGTVKLWDIATGRETQSWVANVNGVNCVAFSPDGHTLASASEYDAAVNPWDIATGQLLNTLIHKTEFGVESVAFSPNGRLVATGWGSVPEGGMITIWDVASGQIVKTLHGHASTVTSLAFSPDGNLLVTGGGFSDGTVQIWDVVTGENLQTLRGGDNGWIESVAFSPDGKLVASGAYSNDEHTVQLWNLTAGQEVQDFGMGMAIYSIAFSPDGTLLAVGYVDDPSIQIYDVATGEVVHPLNGHTAAVTSLAFSPDGRLLASGSYDSTIRIWEVVSNRP